MDQRIASRKARKVAGRAWPEGAYRPSLTTRPEVNWPLGTLPGMGDLHLADGLQRIQATENNRRARLARIATDRCARRNHDSHNDRHLLQGGHARRARLCRDDRSKGCRLDVETKESERPSR